MNDSLEGEILVALLIDEDDEGTSVSYFEEVNIEVVSEEGFNDETSSPQSNDDQNIEDVVVTSFLQRRRLLQKQKFPVKPIILFLIALLIVIGICVVGVLESPLYDVNHIKLKNTSADVFNKLESDRIHSYTDTLLGDPMYRVDAGSIQNSLEKLPSIQRVVITKKWPNTLEVTISPRVAIAYIETDRGIVLVDSQGFLFEKTLTSPTGIPSIEGLETVTFTHTLNDPTYVDIIKLAPTEIEGQIAHVSRDGRNYMVELSDGIDVILGDKTHLKEKLAITWSILNTKKRSQIGYIDVSVPTLPVSGSPKLQL